MRPHIMVLAHMLLAAPPGTPEPPGILTAELADALRVAAFREELMTAEEAGWHFDNPNTFQAQLDAVRERRRQCAGAPPLGDLDKLPSAEYCAAVLRFGEEFRTHLLRRAGVELDRRDILLRAHAESHACSDTWRVIQNAAYTPNNYGFRRMALARLREILGDAYDGPIHPPIAPEWAFRGRDE